MLASDTFTSVFGFAQPGDNSAGTLIRVAKAAAKAGIAVLLIDPASKTPICPLAARAAKLADQAAQDAAKEAGRPGWERLRHACGVYHATTDGTLLTAWITRLTKSGQVYNLAYVPGRSRMIGVDVDTAAEKAGFLRDRTEAEGVDHSGDQPTVLSPGQMDRGGVMVHKDGGHFHFYLPEGEPDFSTASTSAMTAESGWVAKFGPASYLLVPPSSRNEGPYVQVSPTEQAPRWLIDRLHAAAQENAARRERLATRVGFADDPVVAWNADNRWADILGGDGWTFTGRPDACGVDCWVWTKPDGALSPKSATAHEDGCSMGRENYLHLWTDNPPEFLPATSDKRDHTKLWYLAHRDHGGNIGATMTALGLQRMGGAPADDFAFLGEPAAVSASDPDRRLHEKIAAAGYEEPVLFAVDPPAGPAERQPVAVPSVVSEPVEAPRGRPELGEDAKYGLAWDVVCALEPSTESDPHALLFLFLAIAGNYFGRHGYVYQGGTEHHGLAWPLLVGKSAQGKKGTAVGVMQTFFRRLDADYMNLNRVTGLSSSEGLIRLVADPEPEKGKDGEVVEGGFDPGIAIDKRKVIIESEFASVLGRARREGNTLSATVRDVYDGQRLQTLVSKNPMQADGYHISIIGSITPEELMRKLTETEISNGFANRFLTVFCHRSKSLPRDLPLDKARIDQLITEFDRVARKAAVTTSMQYTERGEKVWDAFYLHMDNRPLPDGRVTDMALRWNSNTLRLAVIYALLDGSAVLDEEHIKAAIGCWEYVEASIHHVFNDEEMDPDLGRLIEFLDEPDERSGMVLGKTRGQVNDVLFRRNKTQKELNQLFEKLLSTGKFLSIKVQLVDSEGKPKAGRPATRYIRKRLTERLGS